MTTYVKTTWNTGDVITATRLSNLETQYDDVFTGGTFSGLVGLSGYTLAETAISISSNVLTVDVSVSNVKEFTFNANITTTTPTGLPASGRFCQVTFYVNYTSASVFTWAWLTATVKWGNAGVPSFTQINGKTDVFAVFTKDGGTTWYGVNLTQNVTT